MQELIEAVTSLTSSLDRIMSEVADRERGDDGQSTWDNTWFVFCKERGEVEYKSEEAAYEGGRYWYEHSQQPATVDVFCRERRITTHNRAIVDRAYWMAEVTA